MKREPTYTRLDEATVARLDALAQDMSEAAGADLNRSDAMRRAIIRGLDALDADRAKKKKSR